MLEPRIESALVELQRENVVLYGVTADACVTATALDLLELGYSTHLVVDATTARRTPDRSVAIAAMRRAGVHITTFQSLVFDLIKSVEHPEFPSILPLLKDQSSTCEQLDFFTIPKI